MPDFSTLSLEFDPRGVATLWLDRADKRNAFNATMIDELLAALTQVQARDDLRLLVLRGRGQHFSAGADLAWMRDCAALSYDANLADAQRLGALMARLHAMTVPTLAVVQGAAFGGGLGLVACCDMAIGTREAQFCLSEVSIGLVPAVISPYVVQAIGARATRRYALSAERFNGEQACDLGLLAQCCAAEDLDARAAAWTERLLRNGPNAQQATKALLLEVGDGRLSPALRARTEACIAAVRVSAEGQDGLRAFLDKRPPRWTVPGARP